MRTILLPIALTAIILGTSTARANDFFLSSADGGIWISGGIGLTNITAREYVNFGDYKISQLDWESRNVVLYSATIGADLANDWTVKAKLDFGTGGGGNMVDYDWFPEFARDNSKQGWSHRSIHPDTDLKYYFAGTLEIGRELAATDKATFGISGGFKYTDVKWDANGGTFTYSTDDFRDTDGEFEDGKVISYRQKIPAAYVGFDGSTTFDRLTLSGGVKGGLTFGIDDIDDHWLRDTRFKGEMKAAPMMMFDIGADYRISERASFYVAGEFEQIFRAEGDLHSRNTQTGETSLTRGLAGASFQSASVKFGLRGRF